MSNISLIPARPIRISVKLRHALSLMAREGRSQTEAAKMAALSRQGLAKALRRPAVRDLLEAERLRVTRPSLFHHTASRVWLEQAAAELFQMIRQGSIKVRIDLTLPLENAAQAQEELTSRKTTGCIVLLP